MRGKVQLKVNSGGAQQLTLTTLAYACGHYKVPSLFIIFIEESGDRVANLGSLPAQSSSAGVLLSHARLCMLLAACENDGLIT